MMAIRSYFETTPSAFMGSYHWQTKTQADSNSHLVIVKDGSQYITNLTHVDNHRYFLLFNTISENQIDRSKEAQTYAAEYDKLKSLDASQLTVRRVRRPTPRYPLLEERMVEWINGQLVAGHDEPTITTIQTVARYLATQLGIRNFTASITWVQRFRRRCGK
ncbi:uncharacterized protein LOC129591454 [Paramacrobiotus metropolitanus]|uniref:uncharacterized protein LOC129591454 n=1 Tax=Paramacrobiotus metropolitanus TaxID=2943436 RepID=UPI0024459472|nr:uncharacterized protein LOC129591454 [Paramacrobiotus metropolitanus]